MPNLVEKYKTISPRKQGKNWNFLKSFFLYLSFLSISFEVCQKPKSNLISYGILVQGFKIPDFLDEYKTIFLT